MPKRKIVKTTKPKIYKQYIYLMRAVGTNRYKIGMTARPIEKRLNRINSAQAPYPIILVKQIQVKNAREFETKLHTKFTMYRVHGEWFELDSLVLRKVKAMLISDIKKL